MSKQYYVYIATNKNHNVLYTGVTNNIVRRMFEHKNALSHGFTKKYKICKLIFCQQFDQIVDAIGAEKKIKGWKREKKLQLIRSINPKFNDLL
jgi:putative endonuclease